MGLGRRAAKAPAHHHRGHAAAAHQSPQAAGAQQAAAVAPRQQQQQQQQAEGAREKRDKHMLLNGDPLPPSNADPCSFLESSPHPRLPDLPEHQGELFYECTLFLYSVVALMVQYMNLYKTAWWLPHAHVHNAVKFWMIDPYLVSCIGLILGRRVTLCFLHRLSIIPSDCDPSDVPGILSIVDYVLKAPMYTAVASSFLFSFLRVVQTYPLAVLVHLFYPMVVYVLLFYYEHFLPWGGGQPQAPSHSSAGGGGRQQHAGPPSRPAPVPPPVAAGNRAAMRNAARSDNYPNGLIDAEIVKHRCGIGGAPWARMEADVLIADLAYRCKLSFYSALAVAYFSVYIPTVFAPPTLAVDRCWSSELTCIVFLSSLTLYFTYMFPLHYCDLIHRCAFHMGAWQCVPAAVARQLAAQHGANGDADALPNWSEQQTYAVHRRAGPPVFVQHEGRVYRAIGHRVVSAAPGCSDHANFYRLAGDPLRLSNALCLLAAGVVAAEFAVLLYSTEWNHVVTLLLLMFINYGLLFKLFKDKVILGRIYGSFLSAYSE